MTGGRVAILGDVGKNFAAGMSGGIAYVYAEDKKAFKRKCNPEMIEFETLEAPEEIAELKTMIENHYKYTESSKAASILDHWEEAVESVCESDSERLQANDRAD